MKKTKILLGAHMSIAGGIHKAILRGEEIGCTAIQVFTKSGRSWSAKKLKNDEIELFKQTWKKSSICQVVAHAAYLINIGSKDKKTEKRSLKSLIQELERCEVLGIPYLVLHPGSHLGVGEDECMKKISKNLDTALKTVKGKVMIALETVAGQGTNIGYTFEQLKKIRLLCKEKKHISFCLDTCHIFAAGYDISSPKGYENVMKKIGKVLGFKSLKAIHINDSKTELGSRKDRHANIGKGKIPLSTFKLIMNDKRLQNIPKILETPIQTGKEYVDEIKLLRRMVK